MTVYLLLCLVGFCTGVYMFRVGRMHSIRISFIEEPDFPDSYHRLPTYDSMVFHPRHWGRWTMSQWKRYLARQASA